MRGGLEGLSAMCGLSSGRARVGQEGGVVGVVSCGGREEGGVRAAAAQCLAHISTDSPANCKSELLPLKNLVNSTCRRALFTG